MIYLQYLLQPLSDYNFYFNGLQNCNKRKKQKLINKLNKTYLSEFFVSTKWQKLLRSTIPKFQKIGLKIFSGPFVFFLCYSKVNLFYETAITINSYEKDI